MTERPIAMPNVEVGMETGHLVEFCVSLGTRVTVGQPIFVVEGDKVTLEVESPAAGRVIELCVDADTDVPVGAIVLVLQSESPSGK